MNKLKPNGQRAKNAIILVWIVLILEIFSLISGYLQYELLQASINGAGISTEEAEANDNREQIISMLYLAFYIASAVTFIQWFRRAYFNLHLKVSNLSHTEDWAAVSWFVPFVNLYRPYRIMRELYEETRRYLAKKGQTTQANFSVSHLGLWWTLWIISGILGQIIFRFSLKAETIEDMLTSTMLGIIANVIGIPLALLAIKTIKEYASIEGVLFEIRENENPDAEASDGLN